MHRQAEELYSLRLSASLNFPSWNGKIHTLLPALTTPANAKYINGAEQISSERNEQGNACKFPVCGGYGTMAIEGLRKVRWRLRGTNPQHSSQLTVGSALVRVPFPLSAWKLEAGRRRILQDECTNSGGVRAGFERGVHADWMRGASRILEMVSGGEALNDGLRASRANAWCPVGAEGGIVIRG